MKKILSLSMAAVLSCAGLWAQSQRMVLLEEFTQASCPPCASLNPALNTLLANNTSKVVSVKYQTNWPGVDPMNVQTQSWVGPRVSFYGVTGVPYVALDGAKPAAGNTSPAAVTQAKIDAEYAIPANFTITPTHSFNANYDSIFIKVVYECTKATSATTFNLRVALTEETIAFSTAPGTNGEMEFYNVMRQMYPKATGATGTVLKTTWAVGDKDSVVFADAVPSYIYNKAELGVVAWIQKNTKAVEQAAYSAPLPLPANTVDAGINSIYSFSRLYCNGASTTNADVVLETGSKSNQAMTSCTIGYDLDGVAATPATWTGNLAVGAQEIFTVQNINVALPTGGHTIRFYTNQPNGGIDLFNMNDQSLSSFYVTSAPTLLPIADDFAGSTWFTDWGGFDIDNDEIGWNVSNGYCKMPFYDSPSKRVDEMYLPTADFTGKESATLTFKVAAAQYSAAYSDKLSILVSDDCGATWTNVWEKAGAALATVPAQTAGYTPAGAADFRDELVDMSAYSGMSNVLIKFKATSAYGNNAFLDDIFLDGLTTGVDNSLAAAVSVYPNPVVRQAKVKVTLTKSSNVSVALTDVTGKVVFTRPATNMAAGVGEIALDASELASGVYFLTLTINGEKVTKTVNVAK